MVVSDKDLLFQQLDRLVENLIYRIAPQASFLLIDPAKKIVRQFVEPYLGFFTENNKLNADMATDFLKEKTIQEIENFKQNYIKLKDQ